MSAPARILLVDDSVVVRGLLGRYIDAESDLEVLSTAPNGRIGVEKVRQLQPDLVVLDIEMPEMNGIEALAEIRKTHPDIPIIMFSTLTADGAAITVEALATGASDYATKPSAAGNMVEAMGHVQTELITKIRALVSTSKRRPGPPPAAARASALRPTSTAPIDALVIGSSTGGPVALERVLSGIPQPLPVPSFIVQHMPATFTKALADRLDRKTVHTVVEAEDGIVAAPGTFYVAPGGCQMHLTGTVGSTTINVNDDPPVNSCKPSVEPLFESAAKIFRRHTLAVMLTGMGSDGVDGSRTLTELGCDLVAQDEATSVVWGMPGSVVDAGLASSILPLERIGPHISEAVSARSSRAPSSIGGTR